LALPRRALPGFCWCWLWIFLYICALFLTKHKMKPIKLLLLFLICGGMLWPASASDALEWVRKNKVKKVTEWIEGWHTQETEEVFTLTVDGQTGSVDILSAAVLLGQSDVVQLLIERKDTFKGVFKQWSGQALYHALNKANTRLAVTLLEAGADPNAICTFCNTPQSPLSLYFLNFSTFNRDPLFPLMMAKGGDVNAQRNGPAPIHSAVIGTSAALVSELLHQHQGNPMLMTHEGYFPLWFAIMHNQLEVADTLIAHGVDPNLKTADLKSLLHAAFLADTDQDLLMEWVLQHCLMETLVSPSDLSPLGHLLVRKGKISIIKRLMEAGLDINQMDRWGRNILFEISALPAKQREEMVAFLESLFPLDWRMTDGYGKSVMDYAKEAKDQHMIQLINKKIK
jgi:ankyrin repeat protein